MNTIVGAAMTVIATIAVIALAVLAITKPIQDQTSKTTSPTITYSPTPTASQNSIDDSKTISIALVSLENKIKSDSTFGCGDALVIRKTDKSVEQNRIKEALNELFSIESTTQGKEGNKVYNSLSQSDLKVASIEEQDNSIVVRLEGDLALAGTCDSPRVEEQLKATIKENAETENINIFLNNQPLQETLSEK